MKLSEKYIRKIEKEYGEEAFDSHFDRHAEYFKLETRIRLSNNIKADQHFDRELYRMARKDGLIL